MKGLLDVLFPPFCAACGKVLGAEAPFCERCEEDVTPLPQPGCARCAEPGTFPDALCPRCAAHPPAFTRAWAPYVHDGAIARAIHLLKYEDRSELAVPLGALLAAEAEALLASAPGAAICALPLHVSRYRERRYDQACLLAAELAKRTGRAYVHDALERTRATERQVQLDEAGRERNVAGAFRALDSARGARLILVDDVLTTGATARAAARALRDGGAAEVHVLTLARAYTA